MGVIERCDSAAMFILAAARDIVETHTHRFLGAATDMAHAVR
jgi:hypothetical protein